MLKWKWATRYSILHIFRPQDIVIIQIVHTIPYNSLNCHQYRHNSVQTTEIVTWKDTIILYYYSMFWCGVSGASCISYIFCNLYGVNIPIKSKFHLVNCMELSKKCALCTVFRCNWTQNGLYQTIIQYAQRGNRVYIRQKGEI